MGSTLTRHKNGTQRKGCYRLAMATIEEFFNESQTHHTLLLPELTTDN
jgi:hypothetical protein